MRVLFIDPNDGFRRDAVSLMERIPFVEGILEARSVEDAGAALAGPSPPDVVLLTLSPPDEGNGLPDIRRIGDTVGTAHVVAVTVFSEPEYSVGLGAAGAHDWIPKSDFAAAVGPCLQRLRSRHPPMASEVLRELASPAGRQSEG